MFSEIIGMKWLAATGLLLDFIGVILLGIDLVRLQRSLRDRAGRNLDKLIDMASEYGGVQSWSAEIKRQSTWISGR